jgi:Post-segregation antitoxin CcdA
LDFSDSDTNLIASSTTVAFVSKSRFIEQHSFASDKACIFSLLSSVCWIDWDDWLGTGYLKQKLTLGISRDVIAKAKEVGINISGITEQVLRSVIYDPKGNTKGDLIKAYESLFDLAKSALERYNTNFEVGIKDGSSVILDYNNGLIYHDKNKPDPAHTISLSEAIPHLLPTKNILENLVLATIEGKERNKDRIKELQLALRFVKAIFDKSDSQT